MAAGLVDPGARFPNLQQRGEESLGVVTDGNGSVRASGSSEKRLGRLFAASIARRAATYISPRPARVVAGNCHLLRKSLCVIFEISRLST
ncbi:hypothetical protein C5C66_04440 [Rathayibacter toxicus]|uniref:Uncharacterized protein n=1 Tax=Rathayibacter toxicus TaxID=145458 RepID=A0A0C5BGT8_9MICO|nr:hypothetical protein TI83_04635 [Rathayibacter toxicus]ALS56675.1 hypothetical protein APU90_01840 [Rathayibacter toxicus]KKM45799.1 hypothetical protein VT73_05235 [Rathayibacter toxicus]PPG22337.1 hypothetical protein C5D15_04415 [Rathayibacter toxicus]PPG47173.1 hypothetical protein C5D16_04400 [Rathayibacter toxicus]